MTPHRDSVAIRWLKNGREKLNASQRRGEKTHKKERIDKITEFKTRSNKIIYFRLRFCLFCRLLISFTHLKACNSLRFDHKCNQFRPVLLHKQKNPKRKKKVENIARDYSFAKYAKVPKKKETEEMVLLFGHRFQSRQQKTKKMKKECEIHGMCVSDSSLCQSEEDERKKKSKKSDAKFTRNWQ